MLLRLDKIISDMGISTRSEAAKIIRSGRVTVDGRIRVSSSEKYDPEAVEIEIDGKLAKYVRYYYLMMNKPSGYVSATEDKKERTVIELLEERYRKIGLFPAGRLDKDTHGLLLLTNDGDFAHRVMSPARKVRKKYYVRIDGEMNEIDVTAFKHGLTLSDGTRCAPAELEPIGENEAYITLTEGKYHQVKRMFAAAGRRVLYLKRISVGGLELDKRLESGGYKVLTKCEIDAIFDNT